MNPTTLREMVWADPAEVDRAVAAARAAFDGGPWRVTSAIERGALLRRVLDLLVRDKKEIAHTETLDTGKTLRRESDRCGRSIGGLPLLRRPR